MQANDVDEAMRLLAWMRAEGFAVETVKVGALELTGVIDYCPSVKVQVQTAAREDRARQTTPQSAYHEFGADLPGGPWERQ